MVAIVQPDPEKFRHHADGRADAGRALNERQRREIESPDAIEALPSKRGPRKVGDDARQVADRAVSIDNSRLFLSNRAVTKKLHAIVPRSIFA
jgi:hypothetical protein